jgi:hypothetical protein
MGVKIDEDAIPLQFDDGLMTVVEAPQIRAIDGVEIEVYNA